MMMDRTLADPPFALPFSLEIDGGQRVVLTQTAEVCDGNPANIARQAAVEQFKRGLGKAVAIVDAEGALVDVCDVYEYGRVGFLSDFIDETLGIGRIED
jgi:hypothetical protein